MVLEKSIKHWKELPASEKKELEKHAAKYIKFITAQRIDQNIDEYFDEKEARK